MNEKSSENTSPKLELKVDVLELESQKQGVLPLQEKLLELDGKPQRRKGKWLLRRKRVMHGMSRTPEWQAWINMERRCSDSRCEAFKDYGGRGIIVCERWKVFENFFADMGLKPTPKHAIERNNNDGNYEPDNCKWATVDEQQNNKRSSRYLELDGVRLTVVQWARRIGMSKFSLLSRLRRWTVKKSLTEPIQKKSEMLIEYNGISKTIKEWSRLFGNKPYLIRQRIRDGWTAERAITQINRYAGRTP